MNKQFWHGEKDNQQNMVRVAFITCLQGHTNAVSDINAMVENGRIVISSFFKQWFK